MMLYGVTGIVRRQSAALSEGERETAFGERVAVTLGVLWLITGVLFAVGGLVYATVGRDIVGFSAMASLAALFAVLVGALVLAARSRLPRMRQRREPPVILVGPRRARFQRAQQVIHPEYGCGIVLGSHFMEGDECVIVLFDYDQHTVSVQSLQPDLGRGGRLA